ILLDIEVGHQVFYVRGDRIRTRVGPFWKTPSFSGFTRITVCCYDNVAVNRFFARRSHPATLIIREVVSLDPDVDISTMASGNISQVSLEDMPVENVGTEWKFELVPPRTNQTNRTTSRVDRLRWSVDHIEILDPGNELLHLSFDWKIFAAPDRCAENLLLLTTSLAVVGVIASIILVLSVKKYPTGNEKMVAIWKAIMEGANAYLKRQFRTIGIIAIIIAIVILAAFSTTFTVTYSAEIAFSFLLGVTFSLVAAYIAMYSATNANVRSTAAAEQSTYLALKVATLGGGALGLAVISMSLLGLSILYAAFRDPGVLA